MCLEFGFEQLIGPSIAVVAGVVAWFFDIKL
jgi:hypothetical protein